MHVVIDICKNLLRLISAMILDGITCILLVVVPQCSLLFSIEKQVKYVC